MRVSELAKELNINSDVILAKLKALRLKAKDSSQELNSAVLIVLRSELKSLKGTAKPKETKEDPRVKEVKAVKATVIPRLKKLTAQSKIEIAHKPKSVPPAKKVSKKEIKKEIKKETAKEPKLKESK